MVFVWGRCCHWAERRWPCSAGRWDTVEYAEWRTGARADGVIFSTASFFQKMGKALGGWAVAALLAWFGYVANQPQTAESLHGILVLMICPLLVNVVLLGATFLYRSTARPTSGSWRHCGSARPARAEAVTRENSPALSHVPAPNNLRGDTTWFYSS